MPKAVSKGTRGKDILEHDSDENEQPKPMRAGKSAPAYSVQLSYDHKMMVVEAVAPHVKFLFGKLQSNCTNAQRRDMLRKIILKLRAAGIDIPEDEPTYFKRRILENIRRRTHEKLKEQARTGAAQVHLTQLDRRVIDVFNLEGLDDIPGLAGHRIRYGPPEPRMVNSCSLSRRSTPLAPPLQQSANDQNSTVSTYI